MGENPYNPYAPPNAEPGPARVQVGSRPLASRGQRFAGALIDGLFVMVVGILPAIGLRLAGFDPFPTNAASSRVMPWSPSGLLSVVVGLVPSGYQWWLISQSGQTLGKKVMRTRIVLLDGQAVGFTHGVLLRALPIAALGFVNAILTAYEPALWSIAMVIGWLPTFEVLTIFGASHRCLHDYIAGTMVIAEAPVENAGAR